MTSSHARQSARFPIGTLKYLICCGLVVVLSGGCTKSPTPTPTSGNTTDVVTPASEPATPSSEPATPSSEPATPDSEPTTVPEVSQSPPAEAPTFAPAPEGKVLRHAVFFSFKKEASEADIQGVVDAFRALPTKIPEIIDFQWGVNNSPEGLNDGLTHCFLLTFKDEAGRAAYLPHEAHKAFGNVLRPHKDSVFVVDYWGNANADPLEKELKHAVFFRFKPDTSAADIQKIEAAFAELPSKIDAIKRFEWGVNNSPEKHAAGFTHCFLVSFASEEGRAAYLPHADHLEFVEILKPVLDAPRVLDFWVEK